jgi:hypothetical protein
MEDKRDRTIAKIKAEDEAAIAEAKAKKGLQ